MVNLRYGGAAGIQCTSNVFLATCFSAIKSVSVWKSWDLDYIFEQGDQLIKSLNVNHPLTVDELSLFLKIKSFDIKLKILQHHSDLFNNIDLFIHHKRATPDEIGNGVIFTCTGFSFALIWTKKSIFMFNYHSRNSQGVHIPNGQLVLLEFCSIKASKLFIMKYEKNYDSTSTLQYHIQYIKVKTSETAAQNVLDSLKKQRNKLT